MTKDAEHIGQRYGLSDGDIRRINNKYDCHQESHHGNHFGKSSAKNEFHGIAKDVKFYSNPQRPIKPTTTISDDDEDDDDLFNI